MNVNLVTDPGLLSDPRHREMGAADAPTVVVGGEGQPATGPIEPVAIFGDGRSAVPTTWPMTGPCRWAPCSSNPATDPRPVWRPGCRCSATPTGRCTQSTNRPGCDATAAALRSSRHGLAKAATPARQWCGSDVTAGWFAAHIGQSGQVTRDRWTERHKLTTGRRLRCLRVTAWWAGSVQSHRTPRPNSRDTGFGSGC